MPKRRMGDVIVLLPGILGSVLARDGKDVWAVNDGAALQAVLSLGNSIKHLALDDDPPDVEDLGDGVTAPRLMPDVHLIPGLWKIDGYGKVETVAGRDVRAREGEELLPVPLRLAARQPGARRAPRASERKVAGRLARAVRQRRCQAHSDRALDGRSRRAPLPRGPRRVEEHARAHHVRNAVPGVDQRDRLPVPRDEQEARSDQAHRPHRSDALVHVGAPAAPGVRVRRRRQRAGASERGPGDQGHRPGQAGRRARLPQDDRASTQPRTPTTTSTWRTGTRSTRSSASVRQRRNR